MIKPIIAGSLFLLMLAIAGFFLVGSTPVLGAPGIPPLFTDSLVTGVPAPTALAFTPDGRLLITTQDGTLRVYKNGILNSTPALSFSSAKLCPNGERGLLGVAVDPVFSTNRYIYLYYTFNKFANGCPTNNAVSPVNRVSRFTLPDSNLIDLASEVVLVDNIPSPNSNHNGGDVHFGKDGNLYISIGDGGCSYAFPSRCAGGNDASRDQFILLGKILRIKPDGTIPSDNPYLGADSARCNVTGRTDPGKKCQETFAGGLRNPFRTAFDPNATGTRFFINDVGLDTWEEIDLGQAGADYGWNIREGHCAQASTSNCGAPPPGLTNPIYDYSHGGTGCGSITGGAFVPAGVWPASYDQAYMYGDYVCGKIFTLLPNGGGGYTSTEFITGIIPIAMTFGPYAGAGGPTQALYYATYSGGGQIRRVDYTGQANRPPYATLTATPTFGATLPLNVAFDATGSSDPDAGDTLTYVWNFGDGSAVVETASPTINHSYTVAGTFTATLKVRDNRGGLSDPATVRINPGDTPPTPQINTPTLGQLFRVGETITLNGSATDTQEGTIDPNTLVWRVILHHDTHTHPVIGPTVGNNIQFTAPIPEGFAAIQNSYLEIQLTALDSKGLSQTITQTLQPRKVNITFATSPTGAKVEVNGTTLTGPTTVVSWDGYVLNVNAPAQFDGSSQWLIFNNWSDGGARNHQITTPASPTTYTASFILSSCNPFNVNNNADVAATCGTLRYAVDNAAIGTTITFASLPRIITLSDTLVISKSMTIQGSACGSGPPGLTITGDGATVGNNGLVLSGGVILQGIKVTGFRGIPIKTNGVGNILKCVVATK